MADLFINGIDGDTGEYLLAPLTYHEAAEFVREQPLDAPLTKFLKTIWQKISQPHLGLPAGVDADDVTKAGWGVVFHPDEDPQVKAALMPLVEHRQAQVGDDSIVKVLEYHGQENAREWLASYAVEAGSVKDFNDRYAELSTVQSDLLEKIDFGKQVPDKKLVTIWSRRNDAEGHMIVGDPAVGLRVDELV